MSAERLREAALVLRERAKAARAGRWLAEGAEVAARWKYDGWPVASTAGGSPVPEGQVANATYIATVDPVFGLAVAAWLDGEADHLDALARKAAAVNVLIAYSDGNDEQREWRASLRYETVTQALAVADAILGPAEGGER